MRSSTAMVNGVSPHGIGPLLKQWPKLNGEIDSPKVKSPIRRETRMDAILQKDRLKAVASRAESVKTWADSGDAAEALEEARTLVQLLERLLRQQVPNRRETRTEATEIEQPPAIAYRYWCPVCGHSTIQPSPAECKGAWEYRNMTRGRDWKVLERQIRENEHAPTPYERITYRREEEQ